MHEMMPQEGAIKKIDGHDRYYVDGYWIKCYPPHQRDTLRAAIRLVGNFESRFLKAVEGGTEASTDEPSILQRRNALDAVRKKVSAITDKGSFEYKRAKAEEEALGGMLAVSLFRKMIKDITAHIDRRVGKKTLSDADKRDLEILKKIIDNDVLEVFHLFKYVRRSGGEKDRDEVLAEMYGEPMRVIGTTLSKNSDQALQEFYNTRYRKIAACWKNIDETTDAIKKLIANSQRLQDSGLAELVDDLNTAAKSRCELSRHDPDFDAAASHLRASRNLIKEFKPSGTGHIGAVTKAADKKILSLVQSYRELVYDIAHVRTPRKVSTKELLEQINNALKPGISIA